MRKELWVCMAVVCSVWALGATAQRDLTMAEAVLRRGGELAPATFRQFAWRPNHDEYSHVRRDTLWVASLRGKASTALAWSSVRPQLEILGFTVGTAWPAYRWYSPEMLEVWLKEGQALLSIDGKTVRRGWTIPAGADNVHLAPHAKLMAYNVGQRVEVRDEQGSVRMVTADTAQGIVNGRVVHRNEFGIETGLFWSPKAKKLAFYRMDESMVHEYPLVNADARTATLLPERYPMAGEVSHRVSVGIYSMDDDRVVWLKTTGAPDAYLTNLAWSPDERFIYVAELNRGQDTMRLNRYEAATGRLERTLFTETHPKYVEPMHPVQFLPGDSKRFIWQSRRSGHNHLYLYDTSGKLLKQLTEGDWDVISVEGFDVVGQQLFMMTTEHEKLGRHLVGLNLLSGQRIRLTPQAGVNRCVVDGAGNRFAAFWTSFNEPGGVYVGKLTGGKTQTLLSAPDPLADYRMPGRELVTLKAADGRTDLYGRLFTPPSMEAGKRYPVVVYVYGGPHAQLVTNSWMGGAPYWELLMAQRGYVVFCMDNRGSAGRGADFEQVIHRQLGETELADQLEGVKYLKGLPFVDGSRMGVHGWSFGGFMTINMLSRGGDAFRVGVAGGPVIDWQYYEVMYGERYMDTPQENPTGYERANMRRYVEQLRGKRLLVIHGYLDATVVLQHSLAYLQACIEAGIVGVDTFLYPKHPHNVRGKDRVHLMEKVTDYFDTYLK